MNWIVIFFFFQAEDGIRDYKVTGVQTCALPIFDLGDLGVLVNRGGVHPQWQDHGMGLLRTILHAHGVKTDMLSTRAFTSWDAIRRKLRGYDMLIMNVRSYTFPIACEAARIFKAVNPGGLVVT